MTSKVRVYGKAQNATALGIINAYLVMYPHATFEDLKKAFPDSINPDSGVKLMFRTEQEIQEKINENDEWYVKGNAYFAKDDEWLELADGNKVAVVRMWTKPSFQRLLDQAAVYEIEIAEFQKVERGEKGAFRLEYLNGYIPPVPEPTVVVQEVQKKKIPVWVWILIAALLLGILGAFLFGNKKTEVVEVEKTVVVHDTLYVQKLAEIEKNFNAAEFQQGKAELSDEAKFVLHDLGKLMQQNPEMRLRIEGHTSAEGDAATNQKLSEERAQVAVTFLVEHEGIDASRVEAKGFGSSKPKNADNPKAEENRRTEFEVIE